jgi:hypothetical protein
VLPIVGKCSSRKPSGRDGVSVIGRTRSSRK